MARMRVTLDGRTSTSSPLIMHNGELSDPLSPFALEVAKTSKIRGKSEAHYMLIALMEWQGGLYHDGVVSPTEIGPGEIGPYLPGWHIVRCIQDAARRHKLGINVIRGITPVTLKPPVQYEGPRDPEGMWRDGRFALRKSVVIGRAKTVRTRPVFEDWLVEAEIEVDLTLLDPDKVAQMVEEAGRYVGIGDYRPIYGRFTGSADVVNEQESRSAKTKVES